MHAWSRNLRAFGLLAIIASLLGVGGAWTAAANGAYAAITVHAFWCEIEPETENGALFPACHHWETNALDNAEFTVAGARRWTRDGYVAWKPSAGEHTISGGNIIRYRGATVVCTNQVTGLILFAGTAGSDRVTIATTAGEETICDWYYHYGR